MQVYGWFSGFQVAGFHAGKWRGKDSFSVDVSLVPPHISSGIFSPTPESVLYNEFSSPSSRPRRRHVCDSDCDSFDFQDAQAARDIFIAAVSSAINVEGVAPPEIARADPPFIALRSLHSDCVR